MVPVLVTVLHGPAVVNVDVKVQVEGGIIC